MHLLTRIAIWNRLVTFLVVAMVIGGSIFAVFQLKVEMIPDIEFPMTTVMTVYPNASPEEVMQEVTVPVEGTISGIAGLKSIDSVSVENMSVVFAEFEYGTKMDKVNETIRHRLKGLALPAGVPRQLPEGDDNPQLFPLDMSVLPLVILSLSGDMDPGELEQLADTQVKPRLEQIDGVFSVSTEGGQEKVLISPDAAELNSHGISVSQIMGILSMQQYSSLDDIAATPISPTAVLGDVATIDIGPAPGTAVTRTNGQNSVGIVVMKGPEANTVSVANAVVDEAEEIEQSLGEDVRLFTVFDQSEFIERSISELTREAVIGGTLAVLVILVFLMTVRGSLVIAISIPLSILIGFLVMWAWGITINILTLSGMAIAVGRIVDDSIVLLEVIYRRLRRGEGFKEAALGGAREVALPITSATLATIAIFIPLAFVGGVVGELFVPFALTITFALLASLFVSLMVVPALSGFLGRTRKAAAGDAWYQRAYTPVLKWALGHRAFTLIAAVALFVGSLALVPVIGTSFMPSMAEKMIVVDIEMPLGTDLKTTSEKAMEVENIMETDDNPNVELYYTTVGSSSSFIGGMTAMMGGGGTNAATIEILLDPGADLEQEAEHLRTLVEPLGGGSSIEVSPMESMMGSFDSSGLEVRVLGEDYSEVVAATEELSARLESNVEGITDIERDIAVTLPKPRFDVDGSAAMLYMSDGLQMGTLNMELYGMMAGGGTGQYLDGKELFVTGVMASATDAEELGDLRLSGGLPYLIKLSDIADVDVAMEPTHIRRIDGHRSATITAKVTEKDVGAVNRAAQEEIDSLQTSGVEVEMGGVAEEMEETFGSMGIAIIVAIAIAFAIVVATFRSFISPLIIMVSLPLASIGALLGLLAAGHPIGASALMGMLMLVGIVLTNAIVLIALVEQLRRRGISTHDALVEGGRTRLRPILMTALTTMIALVPLAVGVGGGVLLAGELAAVVIGGLFTSTLLTLLVVPVLYSVTERFRRPVPSRSRWLPE